MASSREDDSPDPTYSPIAPANRATGDAATTRSRNSSGASKVLRRASIKFMESGPPLGVWHAAGESLGKAPTPNEIIKGNFSHNGWDAEIQRRHSVVSDESVQRLARIKSNPKTAPPAQTSELGTHREAEDENKNEIFPIFAGRGKMVNQVFTRRPTETIDDDDELAPDADARLPPPKVASRSITAEPVQKSTTVTMEAASSSSTPSINQGPNADGIYPNGYKFPPKHTRAEAAKIGFKAFCRYAITIQGFLVVIYCLNVVAWGGMLFLLLVGGGNQYMCYPEHLHGIKDCSDLQSPRRIWLEIDSQILNALFCVTGLGLIPWRFRDLYYLLKWRLFHQASGLRRLGGIHNGWFRMPGSHELPLWSPKTDEFEDLNDPAIPLPTSKIPPEPLTGIRAPDTKTWKLDFVIWAFVLNTFLQCVLCGFMWGYNRFDRPSWATGTFIALACVVAGLGGFMTFNEAKKVKAVEGIPVEEADVIKDIEMADEKKAARKEEKEEKMPPES